MKHLEVVTRKSKRVYTLEINLEPLAEELDNTDFNFIGTALDYLGYRIENHMNSLKVVQIWETVGDEIPLAELTTEERKLEITIEKLVEIVKLRGEF